MKELDNESMDTVDFAEYLKEQLVGHKVVAVDSLRLTLDNGYIISIRENEGCGGCGNGWSSMNIPEDLVDCENAIVDVEVKSDPNGYSESYIISIFKENKVLSAINADDGYGNGYYGGGFYVTAYDVNNQ